MTERDDVTQSAEKGNSVYTSKRASGSDVSPLFQSVLRMAN